MVGLQEDTESPVQSTSPLRDIARVQRECNRLRRRKRRVHSRKSWWNRTHQWIRRQPDFIAAEQAWKRARNRKCTLIRRAKRRTNDRLNRDVLSGKLGMKQLDQLYNPKKFRNSAAIPAFKNPLKPSELVTDDAEKAKLIQNILINPPQPNYTPDHIAHHSYITNSIGHILREHEQSRHEALSESLADLERCRIQSYELSRVIRDLKPAKACGPDQVHNLFLIRAGSKFRAMLLRFYNLLFRTRCYPHCWNRANVSAVPKPDKDLSDAAATVQ